MEVNRTQPKSKKQKEIAEIPLHENLPAEEFVKKDDPVPYAELKFFQEVGSGSKSSYRVLPTGFDESKNNAVYEELKKRIEETNTMRVLCGNIKQWIKKHKTQLLKKSSENEPAVIELQK